MTDDHNNNVDGQDSLTQVVDGSSNDVDDDTTGTTLSSSYPPFPRYYNSKTWKLISQGAEARIWIVTNYFSTTTTTISTTSAAAIGSTNDSISNSSKTASDTNKRTTSSTKTTCRDVICKERFYKSYRHPTLNQSLTKSRVRAEVRCITKARKHSIRVPLIYGVDLQALHNNSKSSNSNNNNNPTITNNQRSMCIFMEYLKDHITVKQYLNEHLPKRNAKDDVVDEEDEDEEIEEPLNKKARKLNNFELNDNLLNVANAMGKVVAMLHNCNITHGDLTTSNMLYYEKKDKESSATVTSCKDNTDDDNDIVLIDFGLGQMGTTNPEDKAVDLYVMERALISSHPGPYTRLLWDEILRIYKKVNNTSDSVLSRLNQVQQRGRKRECFG